MIDKNKEKKRLYYYRNRERKLKYQREWDKKNKEKKRLQDQKRYKTKAYNHKAMIRQYTKRNFLNKLLKKYKGCQLKLIGYDNKKLELHHIRYTKKIEDCLLVCQKCHKKIHRI